MFVFKLSLTFLCLFQKEDSTEEEAESESEEDTPGTSCQAEETEDGPGAQH